MKLPANQPPPLEGINLYQQNLPLVEAVEREGAGWASDRCVAIGEAAGGDAMTWGREANENPPKLQTHDRFGNRIDEVEFHPSWHKLMDLSVQHQLHALPWIEQDRQGAHAARAAMSLVISQAESGHGCPISMTYSAVPALRAEPEIADEWVPRILSSQYDRRMQPAGEKHGALFGMAMTERQGGSDVRANEMRAVPLAGSDSEYLLSGQKWFCSAPMCDAFLMLAQTDGGLTCFLVPRFRPDGTRNAFHIQRLKDKLGNRSNASSEIELNEAWGQRVGELGRGVRTIIEMVRHTRLDCVIGSTSLMRQAVSQATHHAHYRYAFGKALDQQPLMQNVLADLCVESEAATIAMMRLARSYDSDTSEQEQHFRRLATAVLKYWICKRGPAVTYESLECLGGNGYVEESGMPRTFRESPLNSIWEGSGNVICLDVLRAVAREPESLQAFFAELAESEGSDSRYDAALENLRDEFVNPDGLETRSRRIVEQMGLLLQASLLMHSSPAAVSDAFIASRLAGDWGIAFGTLPASTDFMAIIDRNRPELN